MHIKGNPVSEGYGLGPVFVYKPFSIQIIQGSISPQDIDLALCEYEEGIQSAKKELEKLRNRLETSQPDKAKIFAAHEDILMDEAMDEDIRDAITDGLCTVEWAVSTIYDCYTDMLEKTDNVLIRERAADLKDVKNRLLRNLRHVEEPSFDDIQNPVVLAAHDLLPSDTAALDRNKILAIITEVGGNTSHSAIIARSYGIPAVLGVKNVLEAVKDQQFVIVDAVEGQVYLNPAQEQIEDYQAKKTDFSKRKNQTAKYLESLPVMKDGTKIEVDLNIGTADENELEAQRFTDGVGLFRTEFLYMGRPKLPTEEEQFAAYKKVLEAYGQRPVTIRTLDIGGDKKLGCMELPAEENPFLGSRALRLCFQHEDIFRTQLRALLRASVYGNLWIMFPMVGSLDDLRKAKHLLADVARELQDAGIEICPNLKVGIMIEIPSIALLADRVAAEVDFASIGTNDLCQYTLAVDRMNPEVSEYCQSYNPGLLRLIGYAAEQFKKAGKPICVCGEMGGDPLAVPVLVGMGIHKLSMGTSSVARVKRVVQNLTEQKAARIAQTVLGFDTHAEIQNYLKQIIASIEE